MKVPSAVPAQQQARPLVSGIHYRPPQPKPVLDIEYLWPVEQGMDCHLVALSVDALAKRRNNEQEEMQVITPLCHVHL
ncbi:MAG: hypothetical protein ACRCXB_03525 [Aeromonadaceae bacterium]